MSPTAGPCCRPLPPAFYRLTLGDWEIVVPADDPLVLAICTQSPEAPALIRCAFGLPEPVPLCRPFDLEPSS